MDFRRPVDDIGTSIWFRPDFSEGSSQTGPPLRDGSFSRKPIDRVTLRDAKSDMLVLSMGEPAGICPEITLRAWLSNRTGQTHFTAICDAALLERTAARLGLDAPVRVVASLAEASSVFSHALPVLPVRLTADVHPGVPDPRNGAAVIETIRRGVELVGSGEARALVTNPIQKSSLYAAGFSHPGHTEYLEHLAGPPYKATMMLACPALRVVLVTVHEALRDAIAGLTTARIVAVAEAAVEALRADFGIGSPRLAVLGVNPHAGEAGAMGREDLDIVQPAVDALRAKGLSVSGPLPPDTAFTARARDSYDVAVCMYHDQGLIPLKALDMDGGVNVTLGLPFVRTSPDHGTALDLAAKGGASPASLLAALKLAAQIAGNRERHL